MEDVPYLSDNPDKQSRNETKLHRLERRVKNLEEYLRTGIYDEDRHDDYLDAVRTSIDHEDADQRTTLRALGYLPDSNNDIIPSLRVIDSTEAYWRDTDIYRVKDTDHVLTQYEVIEDGQPAVYYVPPLAVLSCELYDTDDTQGRAHSALRLIDQNADFAVNEIMRASFFQADIPTQQAILAETAKDLHDCLQVEYDADVPVVIGTSDYFQAPTDVPFTDINWHACRKTAPGTADKPDHQLEGTIINVVYLETLGQVPSKIRDTGDLSLGYGLPCIILAGTTHDAVYYIPAASIVSFYSETDYTV